MTGRNGGEAGIRVKMPAFPRLDVSMTARLLAIACLAAIAGCASDPIDPAELAERKQRQEVTGSHIKRKAPAGDVAVGSREEYERQMDKAHTRPRTREQQ